MTPPTSFPFCAKPGPTIPLPTDASPLAYLFLFLTDTIWGYLVASINAYATQRLGRMPPRRRSIFRGWRDVTLPEVKAFVGVILEMGLIQLSDIKEYWSTHETVNIPFFRRIFSRDRFMQIFWMLHVGEIDGSSRRSKIQPFLDLLLPLFKVYYTPSRAVAIDEAMIAFQGRVSFRQYIRGKPNPWGIKAYVMSDSCTGYLYSTIIYYGKETILLTQPGLNHTTRVVLTLMDPLANLGYDVYVDRFYSSPELAAELLKISTTITGTVMSSRKQMPPAVKRGKQKKGEHDTYKKGSMIVVRWTDKRTLLMLTTKHTNAMVDVQPRYRDSTLREYIHTYIHAYILTYIHTWYLRHVGTCTNICVDIYTKMYNLHMK